LYKIWVTDVATVFIIVAGGCKIAVEVTDRIRRRCSSYVSVIVLQQQQQLTMHPYYEVSTPANALVASFATAV